MTIFMTPLFINNFFYAFGILNELLKKEHHMCLYLFLFSYIQYNECEQIRTNINMIALLINVQNIYI